MSAVGVLNINGDHNYNDGIEKILEPYPNGIYIPFNESQVMHTVGIGGMEAPRRHVFINYIT